MVQERSSPRVVIAIELIMQSVSVEIDISDLENASSAQAPNWAVQMPLLTAKQSMAAYIPQQPGRPVL
jgi:hypothetical protein